MHQIGAFVWKEQQRRGNHRRQIDGYGSRQDTPRTARIEVDDAVGANGDNIVDDTGDQIVLYYEEYIDDYIAARCYSRKSDVEQYHRQYGNRAQAIDPIDTA